MDNARKAMDIPLSQRFAFGENWKRFLAKLTSQRIQEAEDSLASNLGALQGKRFLDAGSGSGLFSLAAYNLGALVTSFDFDPSSVACTQQLRQTYHPEAMDWNILHGSVLDVSMLSSLGTFDIVYSWGVLHHTGAMWPALANVAERVCPGGQLFLSIYNDQGGKSLRWKTFKKTFIRCPPWFQLTLCASYATYWNIRLFLIHIIRGQSPFRAYWTRKQGRGMDLWHDTQDWLGGYPFEVAKPEEIFDFYAARGFTLKKLKTCGGGHGCNEYVFMKGTCEVAAKVEECA